jgi:RNA polymerase sigma factor for flagellar operon FliA
MKSQMKQIKKELRPEIRIEDYLPMVKRVAIHLKDKMLPYAELVDLIQSGSIGLIEAASRYDHTKNDSFEAYALLRIRGAIIDESRKGDWAPKSVYKKARNISQAIKAVENRKGRKAKESEIAEELNLSLIEYQQQLNYTNSAKLVDIDSLDMERDDNPFLCSNEPSPQENVAKKAFKDALSEQIECLPEREKMVISLYYEKELTYREIAEILGIKEPRISQIHSQATSRLRAKLDNWI